MLSEVNKDNPIFVSSFIFCPHPLTPVYWFFKILEAPQFILTPSPCLLWTWEYAREWPVQITICIICFIVVTERLTTLCLLYVVHSRSQQHGNYAGSTPLFDDTSTAQQESMGGPQGMPQQFAGMDFMQAPMTNMAFQYGSNVASHGKEYVEKNVSTTCCDIWEQNKGMYLYSLGCQECSDIRKFQKYPKNTQRGNALPQKIPNSGIGNQMLPLRSI